MFTLPWDRDRILGDLRTLGAYLGVFVVAPNVVVLTIGAFVFLVRPPLNVDYVLAAPVFAATGSLPAALTMGAFFAIDLLQSILPGYHMGPQSALEAAPDVLGLPPAWTAGVLVLGLGAVAALVLAARSGLERLRRRLGPALAAVLLVAASAPLEDRLQSPDGPAGYTLRQDVVTSALVFLYNGVRAARTDRSAAPVAVGVPASTEPLFHALADGTDVPDRVVLVVVESLGLPRDPATAALQLRALDRPAIRERYHVALDTVPFRGSTVPGELRELCRVQVATVNPDPTLLPTDRCLPALLGARGFRSVAVHGFSGAFFRRAAWYPELGFDEVYLGGAVQRVSGSRARCGLAFVGACDGDVADWLGRRLEEPETDRLFLYWLTLNAHSPAPAPDPERVSLECDPAATGQDICRVLAHHDLVMGAIAEIATRPELRPTLFILVGDHPPHLVNPQSRGRFHDHAVPGIVLWPRSGRDG